MLALGLPSYPPNLQAGAQDGAIIAIPTAVRRTMHFGGRARAIFMRGRRDRIRHWRPGHFVAGTAGHAELHCQWARHFAMKKRWVLSLLVALNLSYARADYFFRLRDAALPNRQVWPDDPSPQPIL